MSESIYNLVPKEKVVVKKKPIHRSCHDPCAAPTNSTFGCFGTTKLLGAGEVIKKDGAYFGPPKGEYGLPTGFNDSSKSKGNTEALDATKSKRLQSLKESVPSRYEKPIMGIKTSKNFVTANAVEAILMVPRQTGSPELNYTKKEDFGKVPAYLTQVKEEIRRENEMIERYVKEQMGEVQKPPEEFEEMSEEERQSLLAQLKAKWDLVNAQYQKITHLVLLDTTGQIRRKENFENTLMQLERDIDRLERASAVLIKP